MKNRAFSCAAFALAILCFWGADGSNLFAASSSGAASFKNAAQEKMRQADLRLSKEAASEFETMLESAARKLSDPSEEKRIEAAAALDAFVRELAQEHARKGRPSDEVSRETLNQAKISICPLWPFC